MKKNAKRLFNLIIGLSLIIVGGYLMWDFFIKFVKFGIGFILLIVGLQFLGTRSRMSYRVVKWKNL